MTGRAAVVSPDPATDAGGTERFCRQLVRLLEKQGCEAVLVGPGPVPAAVARHGGAALWQAGSVPASVRGADLVVTTGFLGWPTAGRRLHVFLGNMVRLAPFQSGRWHWRVRWGLAGGLAEAVAARRAVVVAGSEQAAEDAARFYRARIEAVLPLGVDTEVFRPRERAAARRRAGLRPDGRYALFVGRGEPGKGPDVALEACRMAGFELLVAGSRPVAGGTPLGVLGQQDLAWAYAAADAVVLPTRYEGFGYVAVEGLSCGVPVVTTPTGWARELGRDVPGYRPLLVAPEPPLVAAVLARVGSVQVEQATRAGGQYVLEHNTIPAFERRWTDFLRDKGLL